MSRVRSAFSLFLVAICLSADAAVASDAARPVSRDTQEQPAVPAGGGVCKVKGCDRSCASAYSSDSGACPIECVTYDCK